MRIGQTHRVLHDLNPLFDVFQWRCTFLLIITFNHSSKLVNCFSIIYQVIIFPWTILLLYEFVYCSKYPLRNLETVIFALFLVVVTNQRLECLQVHLHKLSLQYQQFLEEKELMDILQRSEGQRLIHLIFKWHLLEISEHYSAKHLDLLWVHIIIVNLALE